MQHCTCAGMFCNATRSRTYLKFARCSPSVRIHSSSTALIPSWMRCPKSFSLNNLREVFLVEQPSLNNPSAARSPRADSFALPTVIACAAPDDNPEPDASTDASNDAPARTARAAGYRGGETV
eukprot:2465322-Rhodomonas_salina.1